MAIDSIVLLKMIHYLDADINKLNMRKLRLKLNFGNDGRKSVSIESVSNRSF